jgi:DNA-binding transcriptional MerR regulator
VKNRNFSKNLDNDWVRLMLEAKRMGIELDQIREFLRKENVKEFIVKKPLKSNN